MTRAEAVAFLRPAVEPGPARWGDVGAGRGTFTEALAAILGEGSEVLAVDRDPGALDALAAIAAHAPAGVRVEPLAGDLRALTAVPRLAERPLDGILFANALHYVVAPDEVLAGARRLARPGGRIVVIEYERRLANPWVPYPLPIERLDEASRAAGLTPPAVVSRRPSTYQGEMYCALAFVPSYSG